MNWVIAVLCVLLVAQQVFWMVHTSALANKLMSRNFHEYEQAKAPTPARQSVSESQDPPEDLRPLQEFTL